MTRSTVACRLCGASAKILHFQVQDYFFGSPGSWDLFECSSIGCGCVFPVPEPSDEILTKAYTTYYTHNADDKMLAIFLKSWVARVAYSKFPSSWCLNVPIVGRLVEDAVLATGGLNPHLGGTIGDIGCGSGHRLDLLKRVGWARAVGVDPDQLAVSIANKLGRSVRHGLAERLPWPDRELDAAFLHHVIEHVRDPDVALSEAFRVLKPGGRISVITPNVSCETHQRHGPHWRGLEVPRHLTIFTMQALVAAINDAGFVIESARSSARGGAWNDSESQAIGRGVSTDSIFRRHVHASSVFRKQRITISHGEEIGDELVVIARRPFDDVE
jgi:SAM-dependent methyltransferase